MGLREALLASLEIELRVARDAGKTESLPSLIENWVREVVGEGSFKEAAAASVAGVASLRLGFTDQAISWLEEAYKQDARSLRSYILAMNAAGEFDKSINICAAHFRENRDAESALLLVRSITRNAGGGVTEERENLVKEVLEQFQDNSLILESAASLRMQLGHYADAIPIVQESTREEA